MDERASRTGHVGRLAALTAVWAVFAVAWPASTIRIEWPTFTVAYAVVALLAAVWVVYEWLRPAPPLAAAAGATAQVLLFANGLALVNYLGFDLRRPLVDPLLASIDRAAGLDWAAYVAAVKSEPAVSFVLSLAYATSLPQVAAAILILALTRRFGALDRYTLGFMYGAILTVAAWMLFPSFGALPAALAEGRAYPPFELAMGEAYARSLNAFHAGAVPPVRFDEMVGLIGCPSFHTVMALLTAWALRGVRIVGPAAAVLNFLVILAVPADGGHHFVDILGGLAVTVLAVALAGLTLRLGGVRTTAPGSVAPAVPSSLAT